MSLTVQEIITEFNTEIGDDSTDRISAAQRLEYATKGVVWLQEKVLNDHQAKTYTINYFDTLNYYRVDAILDDLLEGNDLNTKILKGNGQPFTKKSSQELRAEIGYNFEESSYAIERRNNEAYVVINHDSKYRALVASSCDSLTNQGTWQADTVTSDALNLIVDTEDYIQGSGAFRFDIDVSQSGNNRASIYTEDLPAEDLSSDKDISTWIMDVKLPSITNITSYTLRWGSDSSNYYSATTTTDVDGNPFVAGEYFTIGFNWLGATVTGTPDDEAISYLQLTVNYSAPQTDATSFKVDFIRLVRPEPLTFYYTSWSVGTTTLGVDIKKFTATTDIPYFSGQYDQYVYAVGAYAASLAFKDLRLYNEADRKELDAEKKIVRYNTIFPKSMTREMKSFKVLGLNFRGKLGGGRTSRKFAI